MEGNEVQKEIGNSRNRLIDTYCTSNFHNVPVT